MIDTMFRRSAIPVILQAERSECGLACLAMIAGYFGRRTDLNTLRHEFPASSRGATLAGILRIGETLGLESRPLRLEIADLKNLQLPALLHWDMAHFVVLRSVRRHGLIILDPAVGERRYTLKEAGNHFTGIAVEFMPGTRFQAIEAERRSRLRDLFQRAPGFLPAIAQLFVLSLLIQLASIGSAFYTQLVIDEGLAKQDRDFIAMAGLGFFMLAITSVAMSYLRAQVQLYFSNQLGFQMVSNVFRHLMSLPVDFFERRHVGDLVSRFGSVREIRRIITEDLITVVLDGSFALVTLAVMIWFSPLLAGVVLLFTLAATLIKLALIPRMQTLQEQKIVADARTSSGLMENMRAIETIKFYCRELPRISLWRNQYAEQINTTVSLSRFTINIDAAYGLLYGAENILIVYLAALLVLDGQITLGFLTAFIAMKGNFSGSIRSFIDKIVQIRLVRLQLTRVSDITCARQESVDLHLPLIRVPVQGALRMKSVNYTYPGAGSATLKNISLDLAPGEIIAVVGPSGSGKSTLLKIMAGLLLPDSGTIEHDGRVLQPSGRRLFRDSCAGVLQTDQLLSGSIVENITLFDTETDFTRLEQACEMAQIGSFIRSLPMGLYSSIGDMGSMMSAGQGQRILLARAFYKQPRILLLDEATANLDAAIEQKILLNIADLGITTIMITHRPGPLAIAHRVFSAVDGTLDEIEKGKIEGF